MQPGELPPLDPCVFSFLIAPSGLHNGLLEPLIYSVVLVATVEEASTAEQLGKPH